MMGALRAHHESGKPILAECGGLMYCMETLVDKDGLAHAMSGLLPGTSRMAGRLQGLGLQSMAMTLPGLADATLRGHTYHHSALSTTLTPACHTHRLGGTVAEPVYRQGNLVASYFHGYFPSAPALVARLLGGSAC